MTDGEELIYGFIVEKNAHYACDNVKVDCTKCILESHLKSEWKRLRELEPKLWKLIFKEIGECALIKKFGIGSLFSDTFNDVSNFLHYNSCSKSCWNIYPLEGKSAVITYQEFETKLGVSKDVAKKCLKRLKEIGKIKIKRVMGGYQYTPLIEDVKSKMIESPGEWEPLCYDPTIFGYAVDEDLYPVIKEAQKGKEDFQDYYIRILNSICRDAE